MKSIVIEGWRGINHSYAMVNQSQLLELKKYDINLFHLDLPFFNANWNRQENDPGFDEESYRQITAIPEPRELNSPVDVTYRISYPYRFYGANSRKLYVFGTSEFQHINGYVYKNELNEGLRNPDLKVITPSNWSKVGFLKAGFEESNVLVIPHGVDEKIYKPVSAEKRKQFRDILKLSNDEFAILSLGAMTPNKGIDLLIIAYAILKKKYAHLRLILKDSSSLYGIFSRDIFNGLKTSNPALITDELCSSIIFISNDLTLTQLNGLYGAADCYASPYRAEGFNLTPLEAAASGTPIIVTKGGATDDYSHCSFSLQIDGKKLARGEETIIEPDLESLIDSLSTLVEGKNHQLDMNYASSFISENFSWSAAVKKLVAEFLA